MLIRVIAGMLAASLDTGGNAEVVATWGVEADSYMQALHFCFSLGGVIAPFVAQPFLLEIPNHNNYSTLTNASDYVSFILKTTEAGLHLFEDANNISQYSNFLNQSTESTLLDSSDNFVKHEDAHCTKPCHTKIQYSFLITAICMLLCALPFAIMYYIQPKEKAKVSTHDEAKQPTNFYNRPLPIRILFLGSLSLLMFVYVGTDDIYAGLLMTFVISHLKWTKSRGSVATSLHWMSFGVARLGCVILVRYAKTYKLMIIFAKYLLKKRVVSLEAEHEPLNIELKDVSQFNGE
ncbi:hypothetical protein ACF0H5_018053 [Mactra antiquata]